jgi:plastocyanin
MRSSLGLLAVMLLAAAIGVVAAHSQSQTTAATVVQSSPVSVPLPRSGTVYMVGAGTNGTGPSYLPGVLTVRAGQKVTWINRDSVGHTATADNGAFNSDVLNPGQKYTWTPKHPGTYSYSDYTQSTLQGTIEVKP